MKRFSSGAPMVAGLLLVIITPPVFGQTTLNARLDGFQEVPPVSTEATGSFRGRLDSGRISYKLTYRDLEGDVTEAHISIGQAGVNGGIAVFLCDTAGSPDPTGLAPRCPDRGTVTGSITRDNVIGPRGQGIADEEFAALARAIRNDVAYVNVLSTRFPEGEIRGQIKATASPPGP
jgi:CHRD domain